MQTDPQKLDVRRRSSLHETWKNMIFSPKSQEEKHKYFYYSTGKEKLAATQKTESLVEINEIHFKEHKPKSKKHLYIPNTLNTSEINEFSQSFTEGPTSHPPKFLTLNEFFQQNVGPNMRKKPKIFAETCKHSSFSPTGFEYNTSFIIDCQLLDQLVENKRLREIEQYDLQQKDLLKAIFYI